MLLLLLSLASWDDQCIDVVYDYDAGLCYVEDANPEDAVCSEYREVWPCVYAGVRTRCDWGP